MAQLIVNDMGYGFINLKNSTVFIPKANINGAKNSDIVEYIIPDKSNNVGNF